MIAAKRVVLAVAAMLACVGTHATHVDATVVDGKGQPLADAIVYFMPSRPLLPAVKQKHVIIDQVDKEFVPRVTVVQTGTPVDFPNHDNIRHQVYSFSPAKTFELKLYSGRPSAPVVFDRSGVAVLGCNIHDHMIAWVLSVDTPFFVRSDTEGRARLDDLPAGKYEMLVWHPGLAQPVSQGQVESHGAERSDRIERSIKVETGALVGTASHEGHVHEHRDATGS
jgi:plastocyanin